MKILWLINIPLPEANRLMGEKPSPFGGWLINVSKDLSNTNQIELSIAFPRKGTKNLEKLLGDKITYYPFKPVKTKNKKPVETNNFFESIIEDCQPDIVHIFGTELAHTLTMINICNKKNIKAVISIQGLVSIIAKHMYANLPFKVVYGSTLRNIFRKDNIYGMKQSFTRRGKNEIEALKKAKHLIGRTTWDKACTSQINPEAKYHFCNETLREEFYKYEWSIDKCERHSIFLSQGQYPIKGLHYVLEAMPLIIKEFPDTKLYIGGKDITKSVTIKDKLLLTYYGKYIKKMIRKYKLERHVFFTGLLDEKQMCKRFVESNVFVCPSSIENSPNSLGEAMILGVPAVASDVGGVSDLIKHNEEGFIYQADASYMLAHYVCNIFSNDTLAKQFSKKARERAMKTHDSDTNVNRLLVIYNDILEEGIES